MTATPHLLKDIETSGYGSFPQHFVDIGGTIFFAANNGTSGNELWRSDGTEAGTVLVADINPGTGSSNPYNFAAKDNVVYFSADDGIHGAELWVSDGTELGTKMVRDINPGAAYSLPRDLIFVGDTLYFVGFVPGISGSELWKSDGTEAGTTIVADIVPGPGFSTPYELTSYNNAVYFTADDGIHGRELWTSDGTTAGTTLVQDLWVGSEGSSPSELTVFNGELYFSATTSAGDRQLYKSDGQSFDTLGANAYSHRFLTNGDQWLYFVAGDFGLWRTDGTSSGTSFIADFYLEYDILADWSNVLEPVVVNEILYFTLVDYDNGRTIWKTNDTGTGIELVTQVPAFLNGDYDSLTYPIELSYFNGELYYQVIEHVGQFDERQLWKTDGTSIGTQKVFTALGRGEYYLDTLVTLDKLYFVGAGSELWSTDGTEVGTAIVKDINPATYGSNPNGFTESNGLSFFVVNGRLWQTDGTANGTIPNWSTARNVDTTRMTDVNGVLYFMDRSLQLWKTDGTESGTSLITSVPPSGSYFSGSTLQSVAINDVLYFINPGDISLWKTDGTALGTKQIAPAVVSGASGLANVGGVLYFAGRDATTGDSELWKSDGTDSGTVRVADIRPGLVSSNPEKIVGLNGIVYFSADDGIHGTELWSSDGTEAGTQLVADLRPGPLASFPSASVVIGDSLFFSAYNGLWKTNSTEGTVYLGSPGARLTNVNGTLYYTGGNRAVLMKSDGTPAGTVQVADIFPGSTTSDLRSLINVNGTLYFSANDGIHGYELWTSDGTEQGTFMVADIRQGTMDGIGLSNSGSTLGQVNGKLVFGADDGLSGAELWILSEFVNHAPMVTGPVTVSANTLAATFNYDLLSGASDLDAGDVLSVSNLVLTSGDASGISIAGNVLTINPSAYSFLVIGQTAVVQYSYNIEDGNGGSVPQTASISILRANNPPIVSGNVQATANEDQSPFSVNLLTGASDVDPGDVLHVANLTLVAGTGAGITLVGNLLTVDPQAYNSLAQGAVATVQYAFDVVDSYGGVVAQSAFITINGLNDAPLARADQMIVAQGSSANVLQVLANDTDPDNDPFVIQTVSSTARSATVSISPDGKSVLYTPRTPTSTGTDSFTYTIIDSSGTISTASVSLTILANTVVVQPATLASTVATQQATAGEPLDVVVNVNPTSYSSLVTEINALPPVAAGGQTVFVTLAISDGVYPGAVLSPPAGVVIILNGFDGGITLVGASPALTVSSGQVLIENGVVLTNSTDAPTILVTGGHLKIRNSSIEESTNFARAAIQVTGGTVDLGTSASPGSNTLIVRGLGEFIVNTSGNPISSVGNVYLTDSQANDAPQIASISAQQYTETGLFVQVSAVDPEEDALTYSVQFVSKTGGGAVNNPTGYSMDASGRFHWTPGAGQLGQYTFEITVSDGLQAATQNFTVTTLGVVDGVLIIVGTSGQDVIDVKPTGGDTDALTVKVNEKELLFKLKPIKNADNPYNDVDRILIHALGGNDKVDIQNKLDVDSEIHGGAGDDTLRGGDGHDVIFGDSGNDQLWGGDGNDFLIGGQGVDKLKGEKGDDILIAGRLSQQFGASFQKLRGISAAWAAGVVNADLSDDNSDEDIFDEDSGDELDGGQGADWFMLMAGDLTDFNSKKNKDGDLLKLL